MSRLRETPIIRGLMWMTLGIFLLVLVLLSMRDAGAGGYMQRFSSTVRTAILAAFGTVAVEEPSYIGVTKANDHVTGIPDDNNTKWTQYNFGGMPVNTIYSDNSSTSIGISNYATGGFMTNTTADNATWIPIHNLYLKRPGEDLIIHKVGRWSAATFQEEPVDTEPGTGSNIYSAIYDGDLVDSITEDDYDTEITVDNSTCVPPPIGTLIITNAGGDNQYYDYNSWSLAGTTYTFAMDSTKAKHDFAANDTVIIYKGFWSEVADDNDTNPTIVADNDADDGYALEITQNNAQSYIDLSVGDGKGWIDRSEGDPVIGYIAAFRANIPLTTGDAVWEPFVGGIFDSDNASRCLAIKSVFLVEEAKIYFYNGGTDTTEISNDYADTYVDYLIYAVAGNVQVYANGVELIDEAFENDDFDEWNNATKFWFGQTVATSVDTNTGYLDRFFFCELIARDL